jgi:hypothetical protein
MRMLAWSVLLLAVAGCSASLGDPGDMATVQVDWLAPPDWKPQYTEAQMQDAVRPYAQALCSLIGRNDPNYVRAIYATVPGCVDIFVNNARDWFAWGSTTTPANFAACAAAVQKLDFEGYVRFFYEGDIGADCLPLVAGGTLPLGSPCRSWNQCASGRCSAPGSPGGCGQCVTPIPAGAPCTDVSELFRCAPGSLCLGSVCATLGEAGAACHAVVGINFANPCHLFLRCGGGDTCVKPYPSDACMLGGAGAPCAGIPNLRYCDGAAGRCTDDPFAADGEACTGTGLLCEAGSFCEKNPKYGGDGGALSPYICAPRIADGMPCDPDAQLTQTYYPTQTISATGFGEYGCKSGTCYQGICQHHGPQECHP